MKTMRVYHVSRNDLGDNPILTPRVPTMASYTHPLEGEDYVTARVCVCPTIFGCIKALNYPANCDFVGRQRFGCPIWVYETDVNVDWIYQPTEHEVPDVWVTGELWVLHDIEMRQCTKYLLRRIGRIGSKTRYNLKLMDVPFSRYAMTAQIDGVKEPECFHIDNAISGRMHAFTWVAYDPEMDTAIYYEDDPNSPYVEEPQDAGPEFDWEAANDEEGEEEVDETSN